MAARQIIVPGAMPSRDANGRALPAKLRFYLPDTTTPAVVYTTSALTTPHPFPLPSDSAGRFPQIWAADTEYFDVAWSRLDNEAFIRGFEDIRPLADAVLASVDLAESAAEASEEARDEAQAIATKLGDLDSAVTAAAQSAEDAQNAANGVDGVLEDVTALRDQTQELRDQAQDFRDQAEAIVGFDPSEVVQVGAPQAFDETQQAQGRANIGAQPVLALVDRQKVLRPAIAAGVLTLDCTTCSVFEVSWDANVTSLVLTGLAAGADSQSLSLILVAAGATSFAPGASFHPLGNTAFAISTTAGDRNYLTLTTRNAGAQVDYAYAGFAR